MPPSIAKRKEAEAKRNRAWEMHISGMPHYVIADELGVSSARVTQMVQQAARNHPVNKLSLDERMAVSESRWQLAEDAIRSEIAKQIETGFKTTKRVTDAGGRVQLEETVEHRVDPALLRAWSTHTDRRARQLQNQLAPDANVQAVNVNLVKDFLSQGDQQGKLSAQQWNETVDVTPAG